MAELRDAWSEVGDRLTALGLKVKLHAKEELSSRDQDVEDACARIRWSVDEVIDALRDASRDPAVREDAIDAANAFVAAISATVDEARTAVKRRAS